MWNYCLSYISYHRYAHSIVHISKHSCKCLLVTSAHYDWQYSEGVNSHYLVVTFYKVAANPWWILTHCLWGKYRVSFLWVSGHDSFVSWPMHNPCFMCVSVLKSPYLIFVVSLLTSNSWPTDLQLMPSETYLTHVFSSRDTSQPSYT